MYKVLITGNNQSAMDDFFYHNQDEVVCMSTSDRPSDFELHVKLFQPDIFIVFLNGEKPDELRRLQSIQSYLKKKNIPFGAAGDRQELEALEKVLTNEMDLILKKPLSIAMVQVQIIELVKGIRIEREKEKEKEREKELERLKEQAGVKERKHILIIDDDPVMLRTMKHYLEEDYDVATALSGKIARKFLTNKHTDLILLDYEMPEENGTAVLKSLRENGDTNEIPIVFLTGVADTGKIQEVLSLRPQGYLLKPVDHDKLFQTIENILLKEK